jgi:hypothetical protein
MASSSNPFKQYTNDANSRERHELRIQFVSIVPRRPRDEWILPQNLLATWAEHLVLLRCWISTQHLPLGSLIASGWPWSRILVHLLVRECFSGAGEGVRGNAASRCRASIVLWIVLDRLGADEELAANSSLEGPSRAGANSASRGALRPTTSISVSSPA